MQEMAGSRWLDPIYEAACEMSLPIVIHQNGGEGCYTYAQGPAGGVPRSYGERHAVLVQVGAANVTDMIVSGALERFPTLRVAMVEWGFTWLSWLLSRMDYLWESDRAAAPLVKRRPSEYVAEHFTFATQPLDEATKSSELASMFGIPNLDKMLLFSSDYPHYDTDNPKVVLNKIPPKMKARVCYQNAVDTFGPKILRSIS
jgi:predicted TIM-barrel fold metal-dependent hydrolase